MERATEYKQGYQARSRGAKLTDNPYPVHDLERRRQWFAGWHEKEMLDDQRNFLIRYVPENAQGAV